MTISRAAALAFDLAEAGDDEVILGLLANEVRLELRTPAGPASFDPTLFGDVVRDFRLGPATWLLPC